jgi:adenylate cyclase
MTPEGITRKLIAILSADVKDYTRLISHDDVGTIRTLTAYKEAMEILIKRYRGQVVDATGDNLLARFDSVLDAVNCAAEIQRDLSERNAELPDHRKMEFRMGISLGDVMEEEGRIYGDGVNIAARLQALAEGGGICISSMVHDAVKGKVGFEYEDLGQQSLKNVTEPIRVYRLLSHPGAAAHRVKEAKNALHRKWVRVALAAGVILIAAAGLLWRFAIHPARAPKVASVQKMAFPLPDRPSIAVLPFENLSADQSQDFVVEGMTEGIISALARFNRLFVIARNSTLAYKGKAVKVQQVAEELGVRYVLEGSMEISKDRMRVTAQLIDAISGTHLWVEQFDRPLADVFHVRDDLTAKIVGSLAGKLSQAELARARPDDPNSLDVYGLYWRGLEIYFHYTPADNTKSREFFERALALDPNYSSAHMMLAWSYLNDFRFFHPAKPQEAYQKALECAYKAVALDPRDNYAHGVLGMVLLWGRKHQQALAQYEEGLQANPNDADLLVYIAEVYVYMGQAEKAIPQIKQAMRLNPYHPHWYWWDLGWAKYMTRDYEGAVESLRQMSPMGAPARRLLAASLAQLGRMEEARAEAEKAMKEDPSFSANYQVNILPLLHEKDRQHMVEDLVKAGFPK